MEKFIKDTAFTFIVNILNFILALFSSVIIARVLQPEGKGIYTILLLLISLLITFTNPGIGPATVYYIGRKKYSPKEVFGNNIIFSVLISIFAIFIGLIVIFFFKDRLLPNIGKEYLLFGLFLIPVYVFSNSCSYILLGLQEIKKYNIILLIKGFIYLFLLSIFLMGLQFGVKTAIIIEFISLFIAGVIIFIWSKKETEGVSLKFNKEYFKDLFLYGSKIYLANVLSFLRQKVDMFLVNIFLNSFSVGVYSIARGLSEKLWIIGQSAGVVLFPRVASETDSERLKRFTPLVSRNILFVSFLAVVLFFLFSRYVVLFLYSEAYLGAVKPLNISLIGTVMISGIIALGNDLAGRGKPMINTYCNLISMIANFIFAVILIPKYGIEGAAWACSISSTVLFIVTVVMYSKISGNRIVDIIFIQKSDFRYYKNFIIDINKKFREKGVSF